VSGVAVQPGNWQRPDEVVVAGVLMAFSIGIPFQSIAFHSVRWEWNAMQWISLNGAVKARVVERSAGPT
jgi:hypothetical protein